MATSTLTRTQRQALEALRETKRQWPLGRGRWAGDGPNRHCRWSERTLQALVDAGVAEWAPHRHGVMPHVVLREAQS